MVVYFYEKLSQGFHQYVAPSERAVYSVQVFSQAGYFVFQPDIVFTPRQPGVSVAECVTAGVKQVIQTGLVDPARVGCRRALDGRVRCLVPRHAHRRRLRGGRGRGADHGPGQLLWRPSLGCGHCRPIISRQARSAWWSPSRRISRLTSTTPPFSALTP